MNWDEKFSVVVFLLTVVIVIAVVGGSIVNAISIDEATQRLAQQADIPPAEITVVRHSNNIYVFGDPHDVTLELIIGGKFVTGRCTSGPFSPMVCRLYGDD